MISIEQADGLKLWNISTRVGGNSRSDFMDVKLVQWYIYVFSNLNRKAFQNITLNDPSLITGTWDSVSQASLKIIELGFPDAPGGMVRDGFVDPMRPGELVGRIHSKTAMKLFTFARGYKFMFTGVRLEQLTPADNERTMNMGSEIDMPSDLSAVLNSLQASDLAANN